MSFNMCKFHIIIYIIGQFAANREAIEKPKEVITFNPLISCNKVYES